MMGRQFLWAAREMWWERRAQGPHSSQHMCTQVRTGLAGKRKLLRFLHWPGMGEKESQADMGSFVSGSSSKVMVGSQSCGPLRWTSAGISFGNKEQQYKAGEAELEMRNQHHSSSPSRSTGLSVSACLALCLSYTDQWKWQNTSGDAPCGPRREAMRDSLEEGRGSKPLMGQNLQYQGNRKGEGSPGRGQDHLSQPLTLAERRMR